MLGKMGERGINYGLNSDGPMVYIEVSCHGGVLLEKIETVALSPSELIKVTSVRKI
jgi:hypothetical protein